METNTDRQSSASEFRCLTVEEIASTVKNRRELLAMKQLTLAQRAGVTERTIQRIEGSHKVDDQTLRAVAQAIGLESNAFIGPRVVRTPEEAIEEVSDFFEKWQFVEAPLVKDWRDLQSLMLTQAVAIDDSALNGDQAERLTELRDYLGESLDFADLLDAAGKMEHAQAMLRILRSIQEMGVVARFAVAEMKDGLRSGALILVPVGHERAKVSQALFPTDFVALMGSGPSTEAMRIASVFLDAAVRDR